jgi:hypothetical protein
MSERFMSVGDVANRDLSDLDPRILQDSMYAANTLVVPEEADALEMARAVDAGQHALVLVIDQLQQVSGFLSPQWTQNECARLLTRPFSSLEDALRELARGPARMIGEFRQDEQFNERVDLYLCPKGHYTTQKPCPLHER